MWVIATMAKSICLIFGSLAAAILLCLLLWHLMRYIRHPELGALVIALIAIVALTMPFTDNLFVRMMLLFAAAGAVPLWIAGREWRAAEKAKPGHRRGKIDRGHGTT